MLKHLIGQPVAVSGGIGIGAVGCSLERLAEDFKAAGWGVVLVLGEGCGEEEEAGEAVVGNDLGEGPRITVAQSLVGVVGVGAARAIDSGDTESALELGAAGVGESGVLQDGGEGGDRCENAIGVGTDEDHGVDRGARDAVEAAG